MQVMQRRKRHGTGPVPQMQAAVRADLAAAAGSEQFQFRDPTYHVSESFQQTFDRIGQKRAASLTAQSGSGFSAQETDEQGQTSEKKPDVPQDSMSRGRKSAPLPDSHVPLTRFSQMAFQRGDLAMSVIEGTGKMALVSTLKRTIGQSGPERNQQKEISRIGAQRRNVPGHNPDQMVFNRNFAQSAVGLVVDTLRDARRITESMADMAQGTGELKADEGGSTLRTMYPFLDDTQEHALIQKYEAQLASCQDERHRPILQNALVHTRGLLNKKAQMKVEFINHLRQITEKAAEALAEFEAPGFVDTIMAELMPEDEGDPLPPEAPKGKGTVDGGEGTEPQSREYREIEPGAEGILQETPGPDGGV